MKKLIFILIISFSTQVYGQLGYEISDPISITNGDDSFGKHHPRIVKIGDSDLLVFWSQNGFPPHLYYVIISDGSIGPVEEIPLGGISPNIWGGGLGPEIAAFGEHVYVTMEVYGEAIYSIHSPDGGQNFELPVAVYTPPTNRRATEPQIELNFDGNPVISYINTNAIEEDARYETVRSVDFGQSYSAPIHSSASAEGAEVCECCPASMAIDDSGNVELAFRNNNNNLRDIWVVRSEDGGQTFPVAIDMDQTNWTVSACPTSGPHIINTGQELVSTFFSGGNNFWDPGVYVGAINNADNSVETVKKMPSINNEGNLQNFSRISGIGDTLGIIWQEFYNGSSEIAFSASTIGFQGITTNSTVNVSSSSFYQDYPDVIYDNGVFHIVYEDNTTNSVSYRTITLSGANGINEIGNLSLSVYPNPTDEIVTINLTEMFEVPNLILLKNLRGKSILREQINTVVEEISLKGLSSGTYVLELIDDKGIVIHTEKIIKN